MPKFTLGLVKSLMGEQRKNKDDCADKEKFWKGIEDVIQREDQNKKIATQIKKRTIPNPWKGPKYKGTSAERKRLGVDDAWGYSPADYLKSIGMLEHKIVSIARKLHKENKRRKGLKESRVSLRHIMRFLREKIETGPDDKEWYSTPYTGSSLVPGSDLSQWGKAEDLEHQKALAFDAMRRAHFRGDNATEARARAEYRRLVQLTKKHQDKIAAMPTSQFHATLDSFMTPGKAPIEINIAVPYTSRKSGKEIRCVYALSPAGSLPATVAEAAHTVIAQILTNVCHISIFLQKGSGSISSNTPFIFWHWENEQNKLTLVISAIEDLTTTTGQKLFRVVQNPDAHTRVRYS